MTNPIENVLKDIEKVVAWPFQKLGIANKIIGAALKNSPALQAAVTALIAKIEAQAADIGAAVAGDGLNFDADAAALAQAKDLYSYVTGTFVPAIKAAVDAIEAAAENAPNPKPKITAAKPPKTVPPTATAPAAAEPTAGTDEQGIQTAPPS